MKTTTAKPTPGPWTLSEPGRGYTSITGGNGKFVVAGEYDGIPAPFADCDDELEAIANAELIAEAGTVYHETGLTPREILAQRDELLSLAKEALRFVYRPEDFRVEESVALYYGLKDAIQNANQNQEGAKG